MRRRILLNRFEIVLPCVIALAVAAPIVNAGEEAGKTALPTSLRYTSPIATYRKFTEQPVGSWRDANDHVGRVGGWRTYAAETDESKADEGPAKEGDPHTSHHQDPSK